MSRVRRAGALTSSSKNRTTGCEESGGSRSNYHAISGRSYKLASADLQARCAACRSVLTTRIGAGQNLLQKLL